MKAELAHDAAGPAQFPRDGLPEVAVLGRSNVGKSTFVNALTGRRSLARTSASPGKTRRIHFYRLEDRAYLVDLPGYGYAAVNREERRAWRPLVESYLRGTRPTLRGALLLVDIRRGLEDEERDLLAWLATQGIAVRLVFTKSDKLGAGRLAARLRELAAAAGVREEHAAAVSGRTGLGLAAAGRWFAEWAGLELRRADGTPLPD
jgi:GTP-binding protein